MPDLHSLKVISRSQVQFQSNLGNYAEQDIPLWVENSTFLNMSLSMNKFNFKYTWGKGE